MRNKTLRPAGKTGVLEKKICLIAPAMIALALIAALSFGLNFYAISKVGYGNAYYAAAIRSMTQSFKNFFYVSFDPAGVVSVDKPPLGLWIQALFVMIFGYHGWAMLLPQALAGTASCLMMYFLSAKHFGRPAGLISALVFAVTPAVVVASRNNTMDMQLILCLLIAIWFFFRALETSKWRWLFLCALFVGLGFNIKMLQAYLILPAVAIVYLIFSKEKFIKRVAAGLIAVGIAAAVSFSWALAVDLTPSGSRPYVGSSTNNTVLELIVDHNGAERLTGQGGGGMGGGIGGRGAGNGFPGGAGNGQNGPGKNGGGPGFAGPNGNGQNNNQNGPQQNASAQNASAQNAQALPQTANTQNGGNMPANGSNAGQGGAFGGQSFSGQGGMQGDGGMQGGFGGGSGNDIGTAGPLRMWSSSVYGQASWLLILCAFCAAVKLRKINFRERTARQGVFCFWCLLLVTTVLFFSFAGFWHRYYLCMLAPAIAGIVGPGLAAMIREFRERSGWKRFFLPLSLIATMSFALVYVWSYAALRAWLFPLMAVSGAIALLLMAVYLFRPRRLLVHVAVGCMLLSMLAAPLYWALTVVLYVPQNSTMPYAGPELASTASVPGMTSNQETLTTGDSGTQSLEKYLVSHYRKGSYLVVSQRADDVAQFIVDTGLPAVAYGGFLGTDQSMTLDTLKALVKEGKVTYFLISGSGGNGNSELISYVKSSATLISPSDYGVSSSQQSSSGSTNGVSESSLYLFKS